MSSPTDQVSNILEKRTGQSTRILDEQISKTKSQLRKQNTATYNDEHILYECNPQGETFVVLKQGKHENQQLMADFAALQKENLKLKEQVLQLQQEIASKQAQVQYITIQKVVEVPVQKIIDRIIQKYIEIPVQRVVEVPVQRILEVPVDRYIDRIVEVTKTIEIPVEKIVDRVVEKFVDRTVEIPIERIVQVPVERIIEIPVQKILQKIVYTPVQKIIQVQKLIEVPVEKIIEIIKTVEKLIQVPVQKIKQVYIDRMIEVPVDRIVEIPVEKTIEKVVDKIVPVIVEKTVQVQKIVEKEKLVEVPVERIVQIQKIVQIPIEKIIQIEKIVQVPIEKIIQIQKLVEVPIQKVITIEKIVEVPVQKIITVERTIEVEKQASKQQLAQLEHEADKMIEQVLEIQQEVQQMAKAEPEVRIVEVEKIVEVPVQKIITIERTVQVPVYQTKTEIVQKIVEIPIQRIKQVPIEITVQVPVERIVDRIIEITRQVEVPVDRYIDRIVEVTKTIEIPVERIVDRIVEVPVEKIIEKIIQKQVFVPVEKIVQREPQTIYIEKLIQVPVYVDKEVIKEVACPIQVVRTVEIQKIVQVPIEKIVYKQKIVEVPVQKYIDREITKEKIVQVPVYREKIVQKEVPVTIQKIVQVQKLVEVPIQVYITIDKIIELQSQTELKQMGASKHKTATLEEQKVSLKIVEVPIEVIIQKIVQIPVQKIIQVVKEVIVQKMVQVPIENRLKEQSLQSKVTVQQKKKGNQSQKKQIIIEKIVEKIVQVPKQVIVERFVDVPKEVIIEIPKEVIVQRVVDVLREVIVEVPKEVIIEKIVERIVDVPKNQAIEVCQDKQEKSESIKQQLIADSQNKRASLIEEVENIPSATSLENPSNKKQNQRLLSSFKLEDLEMRGEGGLLSDRSVESYRNKSKLFLSTDPENFVDKLNVRSEEKIEGQQEERQWAEEEENQQLKGMNEYLQEQIRMYEEELQAIKGENLRRQSEYQIQFQKLQNQINTLKDSITELQREKQLINEATLAQKAQKQKIKQIVHGLQQNLRKEKQQKRQMMEAIERRESKRQQNVLNDLNEALQTFKYEKQSIEINFQNLKQDYQQLKQLNEKLQTKIQYITEQKHYLQKFIQQKQGNEATLLEQITSLKSIGANHKDKQNDRDRSTKQIAYLKEENRSLHALVQQLQDEKDRISCKYIEEQERVEEIIGEKDREIVQLKSKDKQGGRELQSKKRNGKPSLILNTEDEFIDLSVNSETEGQKDKKYEEVVQKLSGLLPKNELTPIFSMISDQQAEIEKKFKQNAQLQAIVNRFEKHIKQLQNISHSQRQSQYIQRVEKNLQSAHTMIQRLEREKQQLTQQNDRLQMSVSQLREGLESNFDGETQMLIEQLTSQLQNQKNINEKLQKRLEKQSKELMQYERQFFEKTEKINYLNLLLMKKQEQRAEQHGVVSDKVIKGQEFQQIKEANIELQAKLRKYEIELLRYQKQNKNLQNDIRSMKKSQQKLHTHILNSPLSSPRSLSPRISLQLPQPVLVEAPEKQEVYTLENLVQSQDKISDQNWRIIVAKIIEKYSQLCELQTYSCFEPSNIILIGDLSHPQTIIVKVNQSSLNHVFTAPQIFQNKKASQLSMVWNLGTVIDFILSGKPFFKTMDDVKKFSGYYRSRQNEKGLKNDKFESKSKQMHDILVNMINPFPTLRSSMPNSSSRLLTTLYSQSPK